MDVPSAESDLGDDGACSTLPERWSLCSVELPDYSVVRFVGAGGMGAVFEGYDKRTAQRVAIKTLTATHADALVSLKREYRSVADVAHPNLALAYELAFDDDVPYLVMEFVDGVDFLTHVRPPAAPDETLAESISAMRPFTSHCDHEKLRNALRQLLLGVEALHRAGVLHLDLKPANVLVERNGRVVVLDFGLAEGPCWVNAQGPLVWRGTPEYMSPEQCAGSAEQPADAYAIGVMLFEALTGTLPLAITDEVSLNRKRWVDSPRVASIAPDAPADLAELCDRLLCRKAADRPTLRQSLKRLAPEATSIAMPLPRPTRKPFVGRAHELESLRQAYADSAERAVHVYLSGSSGIGKTTLVRRFLAEDCGNTKTLVLGSRCYERESVAYKAVDGVIDAMAPHVRDLVDGLADRSALLRIFPVLGGEVDTPPPVASLDAHELRQRAFQGLESLFRQLATRTRIVIAIDDLQWGDLDSARLFRQIFGHADAPPALILGAYRDDELERSACLQEWFRSETGADLRHMALGPLQPSEACDLARQLLPQEDEEADDEALVRHVARESGGNPFFVDSLLAYHGLTPRAVPVSLRDVIAGFLADIDDDGRRLMRLLAIAAEPLPQSVALQAADIRTERHAIFARLRSLHLVRTTRERDSDTVEIYHDRIRESVRLGLSPTEARGIHETLAETLARAGSFAPEQLAHHYYAAGRLLDAGHYALVSAERADALLAFERAATLFQLAVECRPNDLALRIRSAEALERAGRCTKAAEAFLECSKRVPGAHGEVLERAAARQLLLAGRIEQGLSLLRPHLRRLRLDLPNGSSAVKWSIVSQLLRVRIGDAHLEAVEARDVDPQLLARIDAGISTVDGLTGGDPMTAASLMLQTLRLALKAREPTRVAWGLAQYGLFRSSGGSPKALAAGEELMVKAEWLSRRLADPALEGTLLVARSRAALAAGAFERALETADGCIRHFREKSLKNSGLVVVAHNVALFSLDVLGSLEELKRRAEARLLVAETAGDLYSQVTARTYAAVAALASNDVRSCQSLLNDAVQNYPSGVVLFQNWLLVRAQVMLDLYQQTPTLAWQRLQREWPRLERAHLFRVQFIRIFALRLHAMVAVAALGADELHPKKLLAVATKYAVALERENRPYARAAAAAIRGAVATSRGQKTVAALEYTRAAAAYAQASMPIESACCQLRCATLNANANEQTAARIRLESCGVKAPERFAALHTL